jgi:iron complex transport system substrate-binding protein
MTQPDPSQPRALAEIWRFLRQAGFDEAASTALRRRLLSLQIRTAAVERQSLIIIESMTPLQAAGWWMPELTELVGADLLISRKGDAPTATSLADIAGCRPDVLVVAVSGADLAANMAHAMMFTGAAPAVYAVDARACFSVAGPEIVETAEILAEILHHDARLHFGHEGTLWQRLES